jgi:CheY-like chemotaxis protein
MRPKPTEPNNLRSSYVHRFMTSSVLVVEDEPLLRADAAEYLENSGFTIYEASNADEAIALLELHNDIRAVFTDIHMPGSMDGLKLVRYVRGRWPPVKLIITSGHAKPQSEDMPTGCWFFSKPYQLKGIADHLRAIFG